MSDTMTLTNRMIAERAGWTDLIQSGMTGEWYGTTPDGDRSQAVPHYYDCTDAALTLPLPPGYRYDLRYAPGETAVCYVLDEVDATIDGTGAHDDTPAGVVCRAWWALMDAEEAR